MTIRSRTLNRYRTGTPASRIRLPNSQPASCHPSRGLFYQRPVGGLFLSGYFALGAGENYTPQVEVPKKHSTSPKCS